MSKIFDTKECRPHPAPCQTFLTHFAIPTPVVIPNILIPDVVIPNVFIPDVVILNVVIPEGNLRLP